MRAVRKYSPGLLDGKAFRLVFFPAGIVLIFGFYARPEKGLSFKRRPFIRGAKASAGVTPQTPALLSVFDSLCPVRLQANACWTNGGRPNCGSCSSQITLWTTHAWAFPVSLKERNFWLETLGVRGMLRKYGTRPVSRVEPEEKCNAVFVPSKDRRL